MTHDPDTGEMLPATQRQIATRQHVADARAKLAKFGPSRPTPRRRPPAITEPEIEIEPEPDPHTYLGADYLAALAQWRADGCPGKTNAQPDTRKDQP